MNTLTQTITPAERSVLLCGETVTFHLYGCGRSSGQAIVRTNLGGAGLMRTEILLRHQKVFVPDGLGWQDFVMERLPDGSASITLALTEPGVYEAKCGFLPAGGRTVIWPEAANFRIKVESAFSGAANSIYCAFVRQFGPNAAKTRSAPPAAVAEQLEKLGCTVLPPSGTFRALKKELDHVIGNLGCRIIQLLPIHPTPVTYGRMGHFGSPFAATDYFSIDPALAEFDPKATPMEQFGELVEAIHARSARIFLDLPVNHTGWASKLQLEHPDYFVRRDDGTFESPGAWGVVWGDLCRLDFSRPEVHEVMAKVFLFWCRKGVDGFRCDAGYMLPAEAWRYIVARVRREYPDTVFLLEGLGGPPAVQEELLGKVGLDWAYSELFQNYTRDEISRYFPGAENAGRRSGILVNFAETHDNNRLAATSRLYAANRVALSALLSSRGAFGFTNGVEFLATEKIDVHTAAALNWGAEPNLVKLIGRLNTLLAYHPSFQAAAQPVTLIQQGPGNVIAAKRAGQDGKDLLLVLVNLDCQNRSTVHFPASGIPEHGYSLLAENCVTFSGSGDGTLSLDLAPGQFHAITFDAWRIPETADATEEPPALQELRADAMARSAAAYLSSLPEAGKLRAPGRAFLADPRRFLAEVSHCDPPPVTIWDEACDSRRIVMVPPNDVLIIRSDCKFRARVTFGKETLATTASLPAGDGKTHFGALLLPPNEGSEERLLVLEVAAFQQDLSARLSKGKLCQLVPAQKRRLRLKFSPLGVFPLNLHGFAANDRGGYSYVHAACGLLHSKYEALLAANLHESVPVDRTVLFTRCRAWLSGGGFSRPLDLDSLQDFRVNGDNRVRWDFRITAGGGLSVPLTLEISGALDANVVKLTYHRTAAGDDDAFLPDETPVTLILRPDLENRSNHTLTKAFCGAETEFPRAIRSHADGFDFTPGGSHLALQLPGSTFHSAPEWSYQVDLPAERYYGMEDKTDLFSPGWFEIPLRGGDSAVVTARAARQDEALPERFTESATLFRDSCTVREHYADAMRPFIVKRDDATTVMAGYPWFLDWGRDTLIALRGLLKEPYLKAAQGILLEFASLEECGTIPNVIRGRDSSNRDTSDAPLWLIVAARDYCNAVQDEAILEAPCGRGRTLRDVLGSILHHYETGTPNGIRMDPESGLIFSPPHFTWMDTNHPAGTPREGYPIEIQALWFAALSFASKWDPAKGELADRVRDSISRYYLQEERLGAADCLHAGPGVPASQAVADDHLRSNMLLAVTLKAVTDPEAVHRILAGAAELLVPGGIRSLADRPVRYQLPIRKDGILLNDPERPFRGVYAGPEDTERKVAYHNGTVWCWPFPAYCEALYLSGGEKVRQRALDLLLSAAAYLESGIPGQLPEVADGAAPHDNGGCLAQAWSDSEFYRVYDLLTAH